MINPTSEVREGKGEVDLRCRFVVFGSADGESDLAGVAREVRVAVGRGSK